MMQFLANWGLLGLLALFFVPRKYFKGKSKSGALVLLFCLGPGAWLLFIPISIMYLKCGPDNWREDEEGRK